MVETFNSQDKERLALENVSEDDDSLNLQNVRISNRAIEKEGIRGGVETSKENGVDINLSSIWSELLHDNEDLNLKLTSSPPMSAMDCSSVMNHSDFNAIEAKEEFLIHRTGSFIDDPLHWQNKNINVKVTSEDRISRYFCSDVVFNLSHRLLTEAEINVPEKGLDYAPIQKKINEPEISKDFSEFYRRMRNKWYFWKEPTPQFSEVPCFETKSSWRPPNRHPALEIFSSKEEKDLFDIHKKQQICSNFNSEEWKNMRSLADDRNLVSKKSDKASYMVVWDRNDYLMEAEKQLSDEKVYKKVNFNEKLI